VNRALSIALLLLLVVAAAGAGDEKKETAVVLRISQVKPWGLTTDHRCVLVLPDHRFHLERATRKRDKDLVRKVYEGEFTEPQWQQLTGILNLEDLKSLAVPSTRGVLVVEDMDLITINIWRGPGYQSMEFLTKRDRAPYERTLKPLLEWWKQIAKRDLQESKTAAASPYCALSGNDNMIFAP